MTKKIIYFVTRAQANLSSFDDIKHWDIFTKILKTHQTFQNI